MPPPGWDRRPNEHVFVPKSRTPPGRRQPRSNAPVNEFGPPEGPEEVRWRGLEPPRACAHKALNLARLPIPPPARGAIVPAALREQPVEHHGVEEEEDPDDGRQAREVALDDV